MTEQEKESLYELQRIDCNCNNCGFMKRDLQKYKIWHDWHRNTELEDFEKRKAKAIAAAEGIEDESNRRGMLFKAKKCASSFKRTISLIMAFAYDSISR
jgi:alpha-galactosidase/6-phospho-beta-glucosidase family protein